MACSVLLLSTISVHAQGTEDPSDLPTPSLTSNINDPLTPALPSSCTGTSLNGPFSMSGVTSVTPASAVLPFAPCAYSPGFPAPPAPPKDIWFRMDPAFSDAVYRFTLFAGPSPAMTRGGMAVYEAPNASGPFRLLDCSNGGALLNTLPSVEASSITPGYKLYVRVWDRTTPSPVPNSNFNICVRGQRISTMPDRGADETPCAARTIAAVTAFSTSTSRLINYVHASDESGFLPSSGEKAGGDLWVKLQVPPTGHVLIKASFGTVPSNQIGNSNPVVGSFGVSAYLAGNCADYNTFKEVGSVTSLVTPAGSSASTANLNIQCLPDGAWLYVRLYALKEATSGTKVKRFGQMRFEWMNGPLPYPAWTPADRPSNCDPCGAIALVVDAPCTGTVVAGGNTSGACNVTGIPAPSCGNFSSTLSSVWHKFTAPLSGMVIIDAKGSAPAPMKPAIALYTSNEQGCSGRMALIACDDRQGPGNDARIIKYGLVPGQTYYVRTWSSTTDGTFSLCVSEPTAPAGNCLYMIDLWCETSVGSMSMDVSIDGGPVTTYTTNGDPSETILIPIPLGSYADFAFTDNSGGYFFHGLWQFGQPDIVWWDDGGYAVAGPAPGRMDDYHLVSACQPIVHPSTDCRGMRTVCMSGGGPNYPVSGIMDNRPKPRHPGPSSNAGAYSDYGSQDYNGYTYNLPNGNAYDLAGANMGCLDPERNGIEWLVFRPNADGTLAFQFKGDKIGPTGSGPADLDFAVWDLGSMVYDPGMDTINGDLVCPPRTAPLRCSSARSRTSTGLLEGATETYDGRGDWGWLRPLPVLQDHGYLIALMPVEQIGRIQYTMNWTLYENAAGVSDPSIILCDPLVLPVELLFLAGLPRGSEVDLTWATATEKNSSHFTVERSTNAYDFTPIGRVEASGNSQYRIDYGFTDPTPAHGVNYYRLKLVDLDGSTDVSNVIAVMFTGEAGKVMVWPNPVQDQLNISMELGSQQLVNVQILDATGRQVRVRQVAVESGRHVMSVDTEGLARGAYVVHLTGASGDPLGTARFVKD